jgi:hypothetical protein
MKDELLKLLPVPVKKLLQKTGKEGTQLIDFVTKEASAYGFYPQEIAPCIMAAYFVYESTDFHINMDEDMKVNYVFRTAIRSALKLLSYGKYKAERTESGWMKYTKGPTHK